MELVGHDSKSMSAHYTHVGVEALEKAVAMEPNNTGFAHWLGRTYGRRAELASPFTAPGYATKARQMFEKSVALDPSNKAAAGDLLDFYLEAPGLLGGGMHKAEELAAHIARTDAAEGHYALALIEEKRKEYNSAEQHLRLALELAPTQVGRVMDLDIRAELELRGLRQRPAPECEPSWLASRHRNSARAPDCSWAFSIRSKSPASTTPICSRRR